MMSDKNRGRNLMKFSQKEVIPAIKKMIGIQVISDLITQPPLIVPE